MFRCFIVFLLMIFTIGCRSTSNQSNNLAMLAKQGNYPQILAILQQHPEQVNSVDQDGLPIIYYAIIQSRPTWVSLCAQLGANLEFGIDADGDYKPNIVHLAIYHHMPDHVVTFLHSLYPKNKIGVVKGRVFGFNSDLKTRYKGPSTGATYLHFAAYHGSAELVKYFAKIIPPDLEDELGITPMEYAIINKNKSSTSGLLMAGATFSLDPAKLARSFGRSAPSYLKWALRHGLLEPQADAKGNTVFHYLAQGHLREVGILELMVDAGWDWKKVNLEGNRAIDIALSRKDNRIIKLFKEEVPARTSEVRNLAPERN